MTKTNDAWRASDEQPARNREGAPIEYRTGLLESMTGISRSTLLYYEKIGVVRPSKRDGSGYRSYTNEDVGSIIACTLLKNCGHSVTGAGDLVAGDADGQGAQWLLDECLRGNGRQRAWDEAVHDELERLKALYSPENLGVPAAIESEELVFFPNQSDPNGGVEADEIQRALFRGAPISSTACLLDVDPDAAPGALRGTWGRSIQARLTGLYDLEWDETAPASGDGDTAAGRRVPCRIESGPCIRLPFSCALKGSHAIDRDGSLRALVAQAARDCGASLAGTWLMSDYLPVRDTLYATIYAPMR